VSISPLERRIQELCYSKAASASEPELKSVLRDLKAALREHTRHVRVLAAKEFSRSLNGLQSELTRRKPTTEETEKDRHAA
jgi:hypothetical protein